MPLQLIATRGRSNIPLDPLDAEAAVVTGWISPGRGCLSQGNSGTPISPLHTQRRDNVPESSGVPVVYEADHQTKAFQGKRGTRTFVLTLL